MTAKQKKRKFSASGQRKKQAQTTKKTSSRKFTVPKKKKKEKYSLAAKALANAHKKSVDRLRIIPLGGMEEVGRNCTVFEYNQDIFIVDLGLQFPEEDMPGIDYIINDITYLRDKIDKIRGVIITHGHYDHIGGIPHLLKEIGNPVIYTGVLTAGIIKKRQREYKEAPPLKIQHVNEKTKLKLGRSFKIEFFHVNHNIPDSFGLLIRTPIGNILHTGDFKFDKRPVNEKPINLKKLEQLGQQGVKLLMADSTNAEKEGYQLSETEVGKEMEEIFKTVKGRMIVGTFASNLSRVQLLIFLAEKYGRKIMIEGRSLRENLEVASELGYIKYAKNTMVDWAEAKSLPDNKLMIVATGAQGERNAVLMRLANNEHRFLQLKKGDTVIFSSSVIPGNERTIQNLKDALYRHGAKVIHYQMMDIHAGGHARQEDLKDLVKLIKPQYYMPVEANHFMLRINAESVIEKGFPENKVIIADNGQVVELTKKGVKATTEKVPTEYIFVDGLGVGDVSDIVLRDRRMMADDGMLVVIVTIRKQTGELVQNPDLISRGFIYMKENKGLVEETRKKVRALLRDKDHTSAAFENYIKNKIRNEVGQFLWKKTQRRPMILPVLIEV